ncbi:MAG: hypothetical protein ACOCRX_09955 [Candidatus Woesearchaeota archaeon]
MQNVINAFNENIGIIQALSSLVLAVVTIVYVILNWKTLQLFKKQVISKIKINIEFLDARNLFNGFNLDQIEEFSNSKDTILAPIEIKLNYSVKNYFSGPGSVNAPKLLIFNKSNKIKTLEPQGNKTIYVKGGEKKVLESKYKIWTLKRNGEKSEELSKIINNIEDLQFKIQYLDDNESLIIKPISKDRIKKGTEPA